MSILKKIFLLCQLSKPLKPLNILRNPEKIIVYFPLKVCELTPYLTALKLVKTKFPHSTIIGVVKEGDFIFVQSVGVCDKIISYQNKPGLFSIEFFRLKRKIRKERGSMSVDFNKENDFLTRLGKTPLRIGMMDSESINYKIKIKNPKEKSFPIKLVQMLCTDY
jgi:hypothetical protein